MSAPSRLARLGVVLASLIGLVAFAGPGADPDGTPMSFAFCGVSHSDPGVDAKLDYLKGLGLTSIQTYIYWNKVEKTPGVMDWSDYDADVALFKKHGLKWIPFLIAGPYYVTPEFVRKDPQMVMLQCLEHGRPSGMPSIWCPRLRDYVRTYVARFAEHYGPMGILESLNIGISGDYGEAIYPVIGNWPGDSHTHPGFWCGDPLAVADFRGHVQALYPGGIAELNRAWHTSYASFEAVSPFIQADAPSERAWQDFLAWYRGSMTAHAEFWLKTARADFPGLDIYLCTGGDMAPEHGSDFSAQAKLAARYGAGIRITNEASSFPMNVRLTRMVDSSCRFYGTYMGHEPAALVTGIGMMGRLFNAVTSGSRQLFLYDTPILVDGVDGKLVAGDGAAYHQRYKGLLKTVRPVVDVALYHPNPQRRDTENDRNDFGDLSSEIRRFVDFDYVDDRMIADGALDGKSMLVVTGAKVMDAATVARISRWVAGGGVAFFIGCRPTDWDGRTGAFDTLAGLGATADEEMGLTGLHVDQPKALPTVAGLKDVTVTHGYSGVDADCEILLSTQYDPKARVAWRRPLGKGEVYTYFGPMDLKQQEQNWIVSQRIPLKFMRDAIADCIAEGKLRREPLSLNLSARDVFLVETKGGVWVLNMGDQPQTVGHPATEIGPRSIQVR